ncbi:MAG TPA: L-lactate permease [Gemmatimonadaceae bacterium]|jgi:lactate permease|nr:L-lactate permease [Gemmatimonadaceae bacterium]
MPTLWPQTYDPLHHVWLSTLVAAIPIIILLGSIAFLRLRAHLAALLGLAAALTVAIGPLSMPPGLAARAALLGAAYGLLPIGWIIINVIFLYQLTTERGLFDIMQRSLGRVTHDKRLQLLLVAFCFGSFFEGASGFGTPVAVTGALLIGLGFSPLQASGLSLIANTAPVAYGALGTPLVALAGVTNIPLLQLSAMVGRQLPFFSIIVPVWLLVAYCGWRKTMAIWPALLIAGVSFAIPQFLISNFHGPWLVDVGAAAFSMLCTTLFLRVWHPADAPRETPAHADRGDVVRAWTPWAILSVLVFLWGLPQVKKVLDGIASPKFPIPGLDKVVERMPPVVAAATPEPAVFAFNFLSATGTGIFIAAIIAALVMGYGPRDIVRIYVKTLRIVKLSLLTISAMLAIGFLTRYSGLDAILGLAFARTGPLYPFFGTMLGWLGVALTGSDTSSNVLFGSLQKITATQLGLNPGLMAAANSSGGVMGKMIDMQSIVVASTTTRWYGHEWEILRFVFWHSLALVSLVGILVTLQAYVVPFTSLVVH